jgi:hypothetical protein
MYDKVIISEEKSIRKNQIEISELKNMVKRGIKKKECFIFLYLY